MWKTIIILIALISLANSSTYHRYIDTDSSTNGPGTNSNYSSPYSKLDSAIHKEILTPGLNDSIIFHCRGSTADSRVTIPKTYDSTCKIKIIVDSIYRHSGFYNSSKYKISISTGKGLVDSAKFICLEGLQIVITGTGNNKQCINLEECYGNYDIHSCILKGPYTGYFTYGTWGGSKTLTSGNLVYNNIIYDFGYDPVYPSYYGGIALDCQFGGTILVANNTFFNCNQGVMYSSNTNKIKLINNIFYNCIDAAVGTYLNGSDYNATDSNSMVYTVTGGGNTHDRLSQTFSFRNISNDTCSLSSTDTAARDRGLSDPSGGSYSKDIIGTQRPFNSVWDIGAFEYFTTCTPPTISDQATRTDTVGVKDTIIFSLGGGTCDSVTGISLPTWMTLDKTGANKGRVILNHTDSVNKTAYKFIAWGCSNDTAICTTTVTWGKVYLNTFSPDTVFAGDTATIFGRGFKNSQGTSTFAWGDSTPMMTKWKNDTLKAICPDMDTGHYLFIGCNGLMCDTMPDSIYVNKYFEPDTVPYIVSITPTGGIFGTQVTVRGRHYGSAPSGYLNGALVPYVSRSDTTYVFNLTDIPERGNVPVVIKNNTYNTYDTIQFFIFYNPQLASITPNHGKTNQGDTVEIRGDTLGAVDTVWFQNDFVIPFSVTDSLVKCEVPAHAPTTVNISVHDTNGYVDTLLAAYEYNNLYGWTVTHPASLDTAGGDTIKFHSEYGQVTANTVFTFDGSIVALTTNTDTLSTYITPAHAKGSVPWIFDAMGTVKIGSVRYRGGGRSAVKLYYKIY